VTPKEQRALVAFEGKARPLASEQQPAPAGCQRGCEWRPCPYLVCRWNLTADRARSALARDGGVLARHLLAEVESTDGLPSCVLDATADGGLSQEDVAQYLGISVRQARRLEKQAVGKMRELAHLLEDRPAPDPGAPTPDERVRQKRTTPRCLRPGCRRKLAPVNRSGLCAKCAQSISSKQRQRYKTRHRLNPRRR